MVFFEFGVAELQKLEVNSIFISWKWSWITNPKTGEKEPNPNFELCRERIKGYWLKFWHPDTKEWEIPFSGFEDVKKMFSDMPVTYKNNPPKAKIITDEDVLMGIDFNGYHPFDYQLEGIKFGITHKNFLLLDEQGLRKSSTLRF